MNKAKPSSLLPITPDEEDEEDDADEDEDDDEEDEPGGDPGGVGFEPPLLHPCNARAPTDNSISARFFKVSLLYVLYL